jgi:hypothetical protein
MWKYLLALVLLVTGLWVWMLLTAQRPDPGISAATNTAPSTLRQHGATLPWELTSDPNAGFDLRAVLGGFNPERLRAITASQPNFRIVKGREGFWRIVQGQDGVWWFLSPDGKTEFLNTVTTVQPFQLARDRDGAQFVSRDYDGGLAEGGNMTRWAAATLGRVKAAGFKGLGAWCNPIFHDFPVPMSRDLNVWKWINGEKNYIRVYSPDFARLAEVAVTSQVPRFVNDRNLVGYYIDNELPWGDDLVGPRLYFDNRSPDDPNRRQLVSVIRKAWPDIAAFNAAWGTDLPDYAALDQLRALPLSFGSGNRAGNYAAYVKLLSLWMEHVARDYFRMTTELIRRHDPNHLILGVRFKGWAPPEVVRASRGLTDAQSLNYYVGDARLDREMFTMITRDSGQPLIITEYSFHALDGRSGNRNTVGFAAQVLDQRARAEGYRLKTTRLARLPFVIGADWFQWADEPPSGRHFDGEDVNFGIVDIDDRPYDHIVAAVRETTPKLNPLHAASADESELGPSSASDVWRESYARLPVMSVPYLVTAPQLNGELTDWPPETRLANVRHSKTLGLERSRVPLPNVRIGWRDEGLYLAFEVFDDDIQGADPANGGWWWTRDCLEWWIATSPPPPGQNFYDPTCHQFFFVPREFPVDGRSGIVGRWHRPGDAISAHLIPEPNVRQVARVLPGRYVVEMLIPRESLTAFDPSRQPRLAFNLHIRNWQHAIDYFWSAPKEVQTQLRPNTWGELFLAPRR